MPTQREKRAMSHKESKNGFTLTVNEDQAGDWVYEVSQDGVTDEIYDIGALSSFEEALEDGRRSLEDAVAGITVDEDGIPL